MQVRNGAVTATFDLAAITVIDCRESQFRCDSGSTCIPRAWICDGHVDCDTDELPLYCNCKL